jgi:hypothetical protein
MVIPFLLRNRKEGSNYAEPTAPNIMLTAVDECRFGIVRDAA